MKRSIAAGSMLALVTLVAAGGVVAASMSQAAEETAAQAPIVSAFCGASLFIDSDDKSSAVTGRGAIESNLKWYEAQLAAVPKGGKAPESALPLWDDPIRLGSVVRGLKAALEQVDTVQAKSPADDGFVVTGYLQDVPISEIDVDLQASGGYVLSKISVMGLATDDPSCAKG